MTLGWETVESVDIVEGRKSWGLGKEIATPKAYKASSGTSPVTHCAGVIAFPKDILLLPKEWSVWAALFQDNTNPISTSSDIVHTHTACEVLAM